MRDCRDTRLQLVTALTVLVVLAGADVGVASETRKSLRAQPVGSVVLGDSPSLTTAAIVADPLPPTPFDGALAPGSDDDDVFTVSLEAGDRLTVRVTGEPGSDIDAYLLWPEATELLPPYAASAFSTTNPEVLVFDAPVDGVYRLDLYCAGPATGYTAEYSIGPATTGNSFARTFGQSRYATAIAVSQGSFETGSVEDVVLARGSDYPDALSASALAGSLGCPLLLTQTASLSPGVAAEIDRLGAKTVHIVGGPVAISDGVRSQLEGLGLTVQRYAGPNRYAVSRAVALAVSELRPGVGGTAFIASGQSFPDALSVSPYSYRMGFPTLLTTRDSLHPSAASALASIGATRVYIAGGPVAVSANVESQLKDLGYSVVRLDGQTRYSTARVVAEYAIGQHWGDPSTVFVASGQVFPDALTGGAACGANGGTMVLTTQAGLESNARTFADKWADMGLVDDTRVLGGPTAVSNTTATSLRSVVVR